jgi:hypothetical protein
MRGMTDVARASTVAGGHVISIESIDYTNGTMAHALEVYNIAHPARIHLYNMRKRL